MSEAPPPDNASTTSDTPPAPPKKKLPSRSPQDNINKFWSTFNSRFPGRALTVLPSNPYAATKAAHKATEKVVKKPELTARSYDEAREQCLKDVNRIIKECRRNNRKYTDVHFDIELDLKSGRRNCLDGLCDTEEESTLQPKGVKRVTDIFEKPCFYENGPTAGDVRQGRDGDCWFLAALCGLGNGEGLVDRVCVEHDQAVGVYGFVFYRDGEWIPCIIDDKLYLKVPDFDEALEERRVWDDVTRGLNSEDEYRKVHQTGSRALYFASCSDENETWLPLLEKAFAKAHGDFSAIEGGYTGEALEDLTGGVTVDFFSSDILDRDLFWQEQLMKVGTEFLFGAATGAYSNWLAWREGSWRPDSGTRRGIFEMHAYSVMEAKEVKGKRLLKLRNPWGMAEWTGAWSDGSVEWTPEWMELLSHRFGDDGMFWMSYEDFLKKYMVIDRTRIFNHKEWQITQKWTSVTVPWSADYHSTKFSLKVSREGPVVIVLSQLDDRYFRGLEGTYSFDMQFRLEEDDDGNEDDYIARSGANYCMTRSVSADVTLEPGTYSVLMKITAHRNYKTEIEEIVKQYAEIKREKLVQVGLSHDLAHTKGIVVETEAEKADKQTKANAVKEKERGELKQKLKAQAEKTWQKDKKRHARDAKRVAKRQAADAARAARAESANGAPQDDSNATSAGAEVPPVTSESEPTVASEYAAGEGSTSDESKVQFTPATSAAASSDSSETAAKSEAVPAASSDEIQGGAGTNEAQEPAQTEISPDQAAPAADIDDDAASIDSYPDFDWRSDLDMDSEAEDATDDKPAAEDFPDDEDDDKEVEDLPWNAICVLGLRVYSKDDALSVEVVHPKEEEDEESPLDRDDPAKGLTEEPDRTTSE